MKNIDYKLDIKKEHKTYSPNSELLQPILSSNKRIFEISYKSGHGKTFLLNLIAFALEANKLGDEYILPSLKESVSRYNNEDYYHLNYNIVLELPDGRNLILKKDKETDEKIIQYENHPPINYYSLHQRVTVLYDVPSNPSERLNGVIKDLSIWNENIRSKIKAHTDFLNDLKRELDNERDEEKIAKYKQQVENLNQKIGSEFKLLEDKKATLDILQSIRNLERLQEISMRLDTLNERIIKNTAQLKILKKPSKSSTKDLQKLKDLKKDFIKEDNLYEESILKLTEVVSSNQKLLTYINQTSALKTTYYSITKQSSLEEIFTCDDPGRTVAKLKRNLEYFKNSIESYIQQEKNGEKYQLNEALRNFKETIEKFSQAASLEILESITNKKAELLRSKINEALAENVIIEYTEITNYFKSSFKEVQKSLEVAEKLNKKIQSENKKREIKSSEEKHNNITARLRLDQEQKRNLNAEKEMLKNSCFTAMNISDITRLEESDFINDCLYTYKKQIETRTLEDINASINLSLKQVEGIEKNLSNYQKQKAHFEMRCDEEENRVSGQYSENDRNNIEKIIRQLQFAVSNLTTFSEIINDINSGDLSKYQEKEDRSFMEVAGRIIAYSMDNKLLWSNGEYITLHSYDLFNQSFQCEGDIVIQKDDLSTGLSSANYLKQRIENVKGDYVVILLDEIGNMSSDILQEVLRSVKKIEEENRLVLALLTHPNTNHIKIIEH